MALLTIISYQSSKMLLKIVCVVVLLAVANGYGTKSKYSVPEPTIEAFSPKGLRLSIPDSPKIASVQFFLSFTKPIKDNDPGTVAKQIDDKQGTHWIYYNQNIALKPHDMVHFKIIVKDQQGLEWSRWGSYPIEKVVSLADNTEITADCDDEGQQIADFPNLNQLDASKSEIKSAYSMHKSIETKPITRSSTTTTSGTFYVKPSGQLEASGYKSSSSYDSTRQDGEQWQHAKSDLTSADIEELKRLHGQDFLSLPAFAHLNTGNLAAGHSSAYHSSSYSSSSSTQGRPTYGSSSYQQQVGQTAETLPLIHQGPSSSYSSYSKYEKNEAIPVPASAYASSDASYIRTPGVISAESLHHASHHEDAQILIPGDSVNTPDWDRHFRPDGQTILQPSSYTQSKTYKKESVQTTTGTSGKPIVTYPEPYRSPSITNSKVTETHEFSQPGSSGKPILTYPEPYRTPTLTNTKVTETHEFTAPKTVTVAIPLNSPYYNGDVFRYPTRPTSPDSCVASEYSYKTSKQIDVVALERNVKENQCLSVLAESITKAEVRALKEANTELRTRLQVLEQQFLNFKQKCQCSY